MKCDKKQMLLYAVTDRSWVGKQTFYEQVESALKGGITCLQLREKELDEESFLAEAKEIATLCKRYGVPFIINDNVEIALKCGADGVHIGQDDMDIVEVRKQLGADKIIGVSAHNVEEAIEAAKNGADYLGSGAMFTTETKANVTPLSVKTLKEICAAVDIPVVAIGGINKKNLPQLLGAGADGVALVSAIFAAEDIEAECRILRKMSKHFVVHEMSTALSIAGSDSSGGAGIQADLKTMIMNGVYAMSAVTALTAQNTLGVKAIQEVTPEFLKHQMDAVFEDIVPDAVKIGMVSSQELIHVIAERLQYYHVHNIVVDPVMVATSGSALMKSDAIQALAEELFPIATIVTPNIPEAQVLSGMNIANEEDMIFAAKKISNRYGCSVLLKGGHCINDANDLLYENNLAQWFRGKRINNSNTHGTGCTLSSAIAANLAKGYSLAMSVNRAKEYISGALQAMLDLGKGAGPMNHAFDLHSKYADGAKFPEVENNS